MAKILSRENVFYAFDPSLAPIAHASLGEEVIFETHDCYTGLLQPEKDLRSTAGGKYINPATGPLYLEGTKSGDIIRIDLLEVKVADVSFMSVRPGGGALGDVIQNRETVFLHREGDDIVFKDQVRIQQRPMIGIIGVAPESEPVSTLAPGPHGGNMDCSLIRQGASLYFTVGVEGALLGVGDLHAAMGDGEIVICGAETHGEVRLKAEKVDLPWMPTPFLENGEVIATIFSAKTIDAAAQGAIHRMAEFLTKMAGLPLNDAGMLMSLVGALKICQVVDPEMTVRFEFPKKVLASYGYTFPGNPGLGTQA